MMTPSESDASRQERTHGSLTQKSELQRQVAHHLAGGSPANPAALIHLEVAGAWDLKDAAGHDAVDELRRKVASTLIDCLGEDVPLSSCGLCDFILLLEGRDPHRACEEVHDLKQAVDTMHFAWHDHPFSLTINAGVLELGPDQASAERWMARAQEACAAARDLAGSGIQLVEFNDHAWSDIDRDREWVRHINEIIS
jgi:GGDEF domain-containing protein